MKIALHFLQFILLLYGTFCNIFNNYEGSPLAICYQNWENSYSALNKND